MNLGKAREYFSAYYEGTLDRGLREGFERVLRTDAQAQAEYKAFESTMARLESMRQSDPVVPDDLHERIMARIDRHAWEKNQRRSPAGSWLSGWRLLLPAGAVAAILALAIFPWNAPENVNKGQILPIETGSKQAAGKLDVKPAKGGVSLTYPTSDQRTVVIRSQSGEVLETIALRGQGITDKLLGNEGLSAILVSVEEQGLGTTWIAIPGSEVVPSQKSEGTLKDLALEISGACKIPVVLQVKHPEASAKWTVDASDAHGTASRTVEPLGLKVELRGSLSDVRTLWILEN